MAAVFSFFLLSFILDKSNFCGLAALKLMRFHHTIPLQNWEVVHKKKLAVFDSFELKRWASPSKWSPSCANTTTWVPIMHLDFNVAKTICIFFLLHSTTMARSKSFRCRCLADVSEKQQHNRAMWCSFAEMGKSKKSYVTEQILCLCAVFSGVHC